MFRRGKTEGWLHLPPDALPAWVLLQGVHFDQVSVSVSPNGAERGLALVAQAPLSEDASRPLVTVPRDLVLCKETVEMHAKSDSHLREVLQAAGEFAQTSRGSILIFLLMQATLSCPDVDTKIGLKSPFAEYIKFLPLELLPTFWSDAERDLLVGTSLAPAISAKMKSLYREYDQLRAATMSIRWCQKYWWDEVEGLLTFDDWKHVDATFRSRALEFPGIGDAMVPCIDMANHAAGDETIARYDVDGDGDAVLLLHHGKSVAAGDEVTITYGDEKGACEQLFSYGFIDESMGTARDIFLSLDMPDDDPLKRAKQAYAQVAPGMRLCDADGRVAWHSDYVWIMCVNEEDGLTMAVAETVDGASELQVTWKGDELRDARQLQALLEADAMWPIFHLRAVAMVQAGVEEPAQSLYNAHEQDEQPRDATATGIRPAVWCQVVKLRTLELRLLEQGYKALEAEKTALIENEVVRRYLGIADSA